MKQRIITGSILILVLVLGLLSELLTPFIFDGIIAIIMVFGAIEFSALLNKNNKFNYQFLAGLYPSLYYTCFLVFLYLKKSILFIFVSEIILILLSFLIMWFISLIIREKFDSEMKHINYSGSFSRYATQKCINTLYTFIYPTFLLGFLAFVNHMPDFYSNLKTNGNFSFNIFAIILTFAITISTDTFAYLFGRKIKGTRLAPTISPNKSVSGSIFGICGSILFTCGIYLIAYYFTSLKDIFVNTNLNIYMFFVLGIIGSIFSQIGDLFESFIKRKANVKDSGKIFPGHGGVLDRFDSLIFNSVIIFIFLIIFIA